jgi:hypothetical protein
LRRPQAAGRSRNSSASSTPVCEAGGQRAHGRYCSLQKEAKKKHDALVEITLPKDANIHENNKKGGFLLSTEDCWYRYAVIAWLERQPGPGWISSLTCRSSDATQPRFPTHNWGKFPNSGWGNFPDDYEKCSCLPDDQPAEKLDAYFNDVIISNR